MKKKEKNDWWKSLTAGFKLLIVLDIWTDNTFDVFNQLQSHTMLEKYCIDIDTISKTILF